MRRCRTLALAIAALFLSLSPSLLAGPLVASDAPFLISGDGIMWADPMGATTGIELRGDGSNGVDRFSFYLLCFWPCMVDVDNRSINAYGENLFGVAGGVFAINGVSFPEFYVSLRGPHSSFGFTNPLDDTLVTLPAIGYIEITSITYYGVSDMPFRAFDGTFAVVPTAPTPEVPEPSTLALASLALAFGAWKHARNHRLA